MSQFTRMNLVTLLAVAIGVGVPTTFVKAQDKTGVTKRAAQAKVTLFIAEFVKGSGYRGAQLPKTSRRFVDLNGDGVPEALVVMKETGFCGARGCSAFVLDLRGAKARSIGDFIAASLEPMASKTGVWRDIDLNGYRMSYRNGKYRRD